MQLYVKWKKILHTLSLGNISNAGFLHCGTAIFTKVNFVLLSISSTTANWLFD